MAVVYGYKIHYLASCDAKSGNWQVLIKTNCFLLNTFHHSVYNFGEFNLHD